MVFPIWLVGREIGEKFCIFSDSPTTPPESRINATVCGSRRHAQYTVHNTQYTVTAGSKKSPVLSLKEIKPPCAAVLRAAMLCAARVAEMPIAKPG